MMLKPVPTEAEVRRYFNSIYRHPDDKEIIYPIKKKVRPRNDKTN